MIFGGSIMADKYSVIIQWTNNEDVYEKIIVDGKKIGVSPTYEEEKTYSFNCKNELKAFLMGVTERTKYQDFQIRVADTGKLITTSELVKDSAKFRLDRP